MHLVVALCDLARAAFRATPSLDVQCFVRHACLVVRVGLIILLLR